MKDALSRQERASLEFHEKTLRVPVSGRERDVPGEPIVRRLVDRGLLAVIPPAEVREPGFGRDEYTVDITERGLTALRGVEWLGECSACESLGTHVDKDGDPACDSCDPETQSGD
jgi:hypothetical protein